MIHNAAPSISDSCIRQCVSIASSYRHSAGLQDSVNRLRVGIWRRDGGGGGVVVDGGGLVGGQLGIGL